MICAKHVCHMCCNTYLCKLSHQEYCHGFNSLKSIEKYYTVSQNKWIYHKVLHQRWLRVLWELAGRADISILCWTQCHIHITSLYSALLCSHVDISILYSALLCSHVDTSILCSAQLCSHVDISILCSGADDELLTAAAADSHWHCKQ